MPFALQPNMWRLPSKALVQVQRWPKATQWVLLIRLFLKPCSCTIGLGNCQVLCYPCLWNVVWMQRLFRYISGNNADNAKIDMTSPVIIFERSSDGFKSAEKNYTVAFYLPQQFQVWQIWHSLSVACPLANRPCTSSHLCSAQWFAADRPSWQSVQGEAPAPKDAAINIVDVPGVKLYVKVHCTKSSVTLLRLVDPSVFHAKCETKLKHQWCHARMTQSGHVAWLEHGVLCIAL